MNGLGIALRIGWHDLKIVFLERQVIFWIFVAPLIFTTFFGLVFRPRPARPTVVALVNRDRTETVARLLTAALEREAIVVRPAESVRPGRLTVVVPAGAADAIEAGAPPAVTLHAGPEATGAERAVQMALQKALISASLAGPDLAAPPPDGPLVVVADDLGGTRAETSSGFQRSVPAYLVMFLFMNLLVSGASLSAERQSGQLRRLLIAPVAPRDILIGKLLARLGVAFVQIVYMLLVGLVVFRIRWADHPWVFVSFLLLVSLAAAATGILLGTLFDDPDKCASVAVWSVIVLSPLGGLWWPLEVVDPAMRRLACVVPTGWAMEGVNALLAFGAGWERVWPFGLAFVALFAVALALAARRFRT